MIDIPTECHLDGSCQSLEDAFYLVVLILSFGLDVEVHAQYHHLPSFEQHYRILEPPQGSGFT